MPEIASTVAGAFNTYDATLNLDPAECARARKRHQEITALLVASGLVTLTFLQGVVRPQDHAEAAQGRRHGRRHG